jgi:hypothetical protein
MYYSLVPIRTKIELIDSWLRNIDTSVKVLNWLQILQKASLIFLSWFAIETTRLHFNLLDWEGLVQDSYSYSTGFRWEQFNQIFTQQRTPILPAIFKCFELLFSQLNMWPVFTISFLFINIVFAMFIFSKIFPQIVVIPIVFLEIGSGLDVHHIHSEPWSFGFTMMFLNFFVLSLIRRKENCHWKMFVIISGISLAIAVLLRPASMALFLACIAIGFFSFILSTKYRRNALAMHQMIALFSSIIIVFIYLSLSSLISGTSGLGNLSGAQSLAKKVVLMDDSKIMDLESLDSAEKNMLLQVFSSMAPECKLFRESELGTSNILNSDLQDSYASCYNSTLIGLIVARVEIERGIWKFKSTTNMDNSLRMFEKKQMGQYVTDSYTKIFDNSNQVLANKIDSTVTQREFLSTFVQQMFWFLILSVKNYILLLSLLVSVLLWRLKLNLVKNNDIDITRILRTLGLSLILSFPLGAMINSYYVFAATRYVDYYGYLAVIGGLLLSTTRSAKGR